MTPLPFARLLARALRELDAKDAVFDLPRRAFFPGAPGKDLSVRVHGRTASTPLGPAAGPHTQLAQNIVLSWLGGCRVMELKTVQALDGPCIPRPSIDMRTVGYNVEWSQELKLEESLEEYVKAAMLIRALQACGRIPLGPGMDRLVLDMSVGYDLQGVASKRVQAFLRGMRDARRVVGRLRRGLPPALARFRDLDYPAEISGSATLSAFHGCPPEEIESIAHALLNEGLDCAVKLNPTLLGAKELRGLLHDRLGYADIVVPDSAFDKDAAWEQVLGLVERLDRKARALGRSFGVKLTNTLVVENRAGFLPASEKLAYLSGPPLHVLAMALVRRLRGVLGDRLPISFSAGIDRLNFPDAVALGLAPVTVCTDLLKPGGYARLRGYFEEIVQRMDAVGAATVDEFILKAYGPAAGRPCSAPAVPAGWGPAEAAGGLSRARLRNTELYAGGVAQDPRYARSRHARAPRKSAKRLSLFDCIVCDKCIGVCPNDANFVLDLPSASIPIVKLVRVEGGWASSAGGMLRIERKRQVANYAGFCNECGNCDVFCPESGGPYALKPRFFGSLEGWRGARGDGFHAAKGSEGDVLHGRIQGREFRLAVRGERADFSGKGFSLRFKTGDPAGTAEGDARTEVDLTCFHIMDRLLKAVLAPDAVNYVNC